MWPGRSRETIEQARYAASLVKISYDAAEPLLTMEAAANKAKKPKKNKDDRYQIKKGDVAKRFEGREPGQDRADLHHADRDAQPDRNRPARSRVWEGDDKLTVHDATQFVKGVQNISRACMA